MGTSPTPQNSLGAHGRVARFLDQHPAPWKYNGSRVVDSRGETVLSGGCVDMDNADLELDDVLQSLIVAMPELLHVLQPLAAVADAFDANGLDEARPEWKDLVARHCVEPNKDGSIPEQVILLAGRGGRPLLTLADALAARKALGR